MIMMMIIIPLKENEETAVVPISVYLLIDLLQSFVNNLLNR